MAKHPRPQNPPARDTTDATKKALGSLGYLSGSSRKGASNEDPKDRLAEYQMFDRALDAMYSQRLDAYMRAGKPENAVREWTAALASDPQYAPAAQALGEYYMTLRDWTKARAYLQQALAAAPGDPAIRQELDLVERNLRP
jgi:tetratricopeptide (TPR) repeat protein